MAALEGMKAIRTHENGKSEVTVLRLIREEGYPARKVLGTWNTTTTLVDEWREEKLREKLKEPA